MASKPPPSKVSVSNKPISDAWSFPVKFLKGVGPKISDLLARDGIRTLWDLLLTLPRTYEDRRKFHSPAEMRAAAGLNQPILGRAQIEGYSAKHAGFGGRRMTEALARLTGEGAGDGVFGERVLFTWFHDPGGSIQKRFPEKSIVLFRGKPQLFRGQIQIVHPELQPTDQELPRWEFGGFIPVYREVQGLSTRLLRKIMFGALQRPEFQELPEGLPDDMRKRLDLPPFRQSLAELHFPKSWEPDGHLPRPSGPFLKRVAFEELFMMALALHLRRAEWKREEERNAKRIPKISVTPERVRGWEESLPFALTGDQRRAAAEILSDLALTEGAVSMHRLVQGDVGSGKTVVAFMAALAAMEAGYQVAFMAPTEILADQHFGNFSRMFPEKAHEVLLLKGALGAKAKNEARAALAEGRARFAIGTQALLADKTLFDRLGLVIIDEQHRFGVEQRIGLKQQTEGLIPHLLVMTATPIPRSLALTYYGDLNVSLIREKPAGRTPIRTHVVKKRARAALADRLKKFVEENRQIYIVYPLVEESEELDLKDVQNAFKEWSAIFGPEKVALLHGRMKSAEKEAVMRDFKAGRSQVLVSTTVIEVGVDVPNASVIVIEHAERFGLSQLHQLRGRVGRGAKESFCVLVGPDAPGPEASERLRIMEASDDGFEIAETDLRMRGPGEFLGRRQSGLLGFRVADLLRDTSLMELSRDEARAILEEDPRLELPRNAGLRRLLEKWWSGRMELTLSG